MAVRLLANEVSDLCLGKPPLRCLSVSATVADAIAALRKSGSGCVSVWSCDHSSKDAFSGDCQCVGKVSIVDIVCFLCKEENLSSPSTALQSPVEAVVPKVPGLVRHLEPHSSLLEAIELILEGAQNLVVPIVSRSLPIPRKKLLQKQNSTLHNTRQYCWLTQEDIIRYLLNSIGLFCPTPICPINSLGIIETESILAVHYDDPASSTLPLISKSHITQIGIGIVDSDGKLIGEISPFTLDTCDLTVLGAIKTLSAGELMAYIDCGGPPEDLVQIVKERLEEKKLGKLSEFIDEEESVNAYSSSSSGSSDEEFGLGRSGRSGGYYSARMVRRSEATMCYPWSSLVAVMIQALAHRVSYVWVVEEDGSLTGIVTFASMLEVFHERLKSMA
ncbi:CBS domain-containing protein CBSX5-like [Punica granatum]|uniref:CBS domain-containing protein n=2 Tax=Punica granatum TaxID=22663 RepID=A0A218WY63_PUNGR|nr:CBS domain-containing protein CBSX5-like [Punica granatum]OWM77486.1 hypothetical protein CDL15_Pgr016883 [Punica granatum]PKI69310.1 hypothetical protein CRG98_010311 [Punica granatum]